MMESSSRLTLSIIKPDAVRRKLMGSINSTIESNGFRIVAIKMIQLSADHASQFYDIHRERPFFPGLIKVMTCGPCVVQVLHGERAVSRYRALMGATDPQKAEPNTIRALFGIDLDRNAVHGSDSDDNAGYEISFFFSQTEILLPPSFDE